MVRELHVYGQMVPVFKTNMGGKNSKETQHLGFGKRLMTAAETISALEGYRKVSVIAGIGTRNYYRKIGYRRRGTYMVRALDGWTRAKYRWLSRMRLQRTRISHAKTVQTLRERTGYDSALS